MGVKTVISGLSLAGNHLAAAKANAHDAESLRQMILEHTAELIVKLRALSADMQGGDGNIATINTQITALS